MVQFVHILSVPILLPEVFNVRLNFGFQVRVGNRKSAYRILSGSPGQGISLFISLNPHMAWNPNKNNVETIRFKGSIGLKKFNK